MGTVTSIVVSADDVDRLGAGVVHEALTAARAFLEAMDHRFSHYAVDSEITSWLGGGSASPDAVADFTHVLRQCGRLRDESGGVFTIKNPATGTVDTAGYVKGYAIGRAAAVIRDRGLANFIVSVGGDSHCAGRASAERPWRVAVADPTRDRAVAAIVDASNLAVATSGRAERGDHIWSLVPDSGSGVLSFTVVGPAIAEADAYATIGFAMGEEGVAWVSAHEGYRSIVVRADGTLAGDAALVSAA